MDRGGDFLIGFLFRIIAGAVMSVQGVMNTRLQEGTGLWEANAYVQGTAFLLSLAAMWLFGSGNLKQLAHMPLWTLLGGAVGLVITVTVMLSIKGLNPTMAVSVILIAQLVTAALIEAFGWLGQEKTALGIRQLMGLGLMLGGIALFKMR